MIIINAKGLPQEEKGGKICKQRQTRGNLQQTVDRKNVKQNHESKNVITDSGATPHMVNFQDNMTNHKDVKT